MQYGIHAANGTCSLRLIVRGISAHFNTSDGRCVSVSGAVMLLMGLQWRVITMKRYVIRLLLFAVAFNCLFPLLPGAQFHGNFAHALLAGALFAFFGWLIEFLAVSISAILAIGTLGMALILLVPAWLFGFWLLPAVTLKAVSVVIPSIVQFTGWMPAIWSGLIMLLIGILTSGDLHWTVRNGKNRRVDAAA